MNRSRWHLAVPVLFALLSACDSPATIQPVASISIAPAEPVLMLGDTLRMAAIPRDGAGNMNGGHAVTWSSSAPGIVSVSSAGLLTAQGWGTATIAAAAGGQSVTVPVTVRRRPPVVTGLTISPGEANVGTADAPVEFAITAQAEGGMASISLQLESVRPGAFNHQWQACSTGPVPAMGTSRAGTWKCAIQLPRSSVGGDWRVKSLGATDSAGTRTIYSDAQLAATGMNPVLKVQSPNEDVTPPVATALSVQPATVNLATGAKVVEFTFTTTDAASGMWRGSVGISPPGTGVGWGCGGGPLEGEGVATGTFKCSIPVPANAAAGKWTITLEVLDMTRNLRQYRSEQLQAAGLVHEITVTN
ncbi:Ig-like domain-containing protein [Longimicrobium sp.]|jgi:hypothetical protein|uniref:Ig-like domain-containing protein n=1 Tax=Longimicrobium sp. TaxID=2029185 RepID=UPI002EDA1CFF